MNGRAPLIAGVAVLSFFAGITGVRLAYTLAYVLLLLLVLAFGWSRVAARRLRVTRASPEGTFMVGESFVERFSVRNDGPAPIAYCEVHDGTRLPGYLPGRAFSLAGGGTVSWTARGTFTRRGVWSFGPLEARLGDPFGLFPKRIHVAARHGVIVYPRLHSIGHVSPLVSGNAGAGDGRHGRATDLPPDVSTVRDYDSADGLSRIHWASTARTGRLMSRVFDTQQSTDILVMLDLERGHAAGEAPESTLEYAVSLAASICHAGLRRGQAVGLVTNDAARTAIGAGRGEAQRMRILQYLATCDDDGTTPLAQTVRQYGDGWRTRGGIVVLTSNRSSEWVEALTEVGNRGQRHLAIIVEPSSFGAPGPALRVAAAWRLAMDIWLVRRGDELGAGRGRRTAAL